MTPHLNCLNETVQMRTHNISFYAELTKIIPNYHQILLLIWSSAYCICGENTANFYKKNIAKINKTRLISFQRFLFATTQLLISSITLLNKTMAKSSKLFLCHKNDIVIQPLSHMCNYVIIEQKNLPYIR